jgi:hypothetical protein
MPSKNCNYNETGVDQVSILTPSHEMLTIFQGSNVADYSIHCLPMTISLRSIRLVKQGTAIQHNGCSKLLNLVTGTKALSHLGSGVRAKVSYTNMFD